MAMKIQNKQLWHAHGLNNKTEMGDEFLWKFNLQNKETCINKT